MDTQQSATPAVSNTQEASPCFLLKISPHSGISQQVLKKMSSSQCGWGPVLSWSQVPDGSWGDPAPVSCAEPGLWAKQAVPALVSQVGLSPSAGKIVKCRLHPLSSVETQYPAQHPTESTKVWKYRWMEANIPWLLKKSCRTIRNHTQWNECRHELYNLHPKSLKIVHRHIYNIKL